jgi:hypothetical protein
VSPDGTSDPRRWSRGDTVALREIWLGRIWFARPAIVVEDLPEMTTFHVPSGIRFMQPVDDEGTYLKVYADAWDLAAAPWGSPDFALSFAFPQTPYGVILGYEPPGELRDYYVNLQTPLRRTAIGFDYTDHLLDVVIPADRSSWAWKDEDELEAAVRRGLFSEAEAAWFRHWGERAAEHVLLGQPPFDRDWSTWRPDPAWGVPVLPDGWDTVAVG